MNVLHLHLSDWAGVRFQVPAYPQLTAGLNGQFYTAQDAADLVAYAKGRGVRIVPEVLPRPRRCCWRSAWWALRRAPGVFAQLHRCAQLGMRVSAIVAAWALACVFLKKSACAL